MNGSTRLSVFLSAFSLLTRSARSIAGLSLVVDVIGAISNAAMLGIAGRLLGMLGDDPTWDAVFPWLIAAAIALAINMITSSLHSELISLASEHVHAHAVEGVLAAAAGVPFASFDRSDFYDRFSRAYAGGSQDAWAIVYSTLGLIRSILDVLGIIVILAFVAPVLIVIALAAYIPMWLVARLNNNARYQFSWSETEPDRRRGYIEYLLSGREPAKEVRAFSLETDLLDQFRELWAERLERVTGLVRGIALRAAIAHLAASLVVTTALGVVVWLTVQGELSLDQAGVGVLGVRQLSGGVSRMSGSIESLHGSAQFLGDYEAFLDDAGALRDESDPAAAPEQISRIELKSVGFRYPGVDVDALTDVSIEIHAGQVTAVVGANGSGKTTLMMLLAGMYDLDSGSIHWDDTDVSTVPLETRQRVASSLFQDFVHFHLNVIDNVAPVQGASPADIRDALDLAEASEFVAKLPQGTESQLGRSFTNGTELSIGQWQRLALARALHKDAPIVLLDEPASALDPGAESRLVRRLKSTYADRCVVMISHRFASVRQADKIIVLDEGRVIEQGNHDELVALGGAYNALFQAQAAPLLGESPE